MLQSVRLIVYGNHKYSSLTVFNDPSRYSLLKFWAKLLIFEILILSSSRKAIVEMSFGQTLVQYEHLLKHYNNYNLVSANRPSKTYVIKIDQAPQYIEWSDRGITEEF